MRTENLQEMRGVALKREGVECLLNNDQQRMEAIADELQRRLKVALVQKCPHCESERVRETSPGDGYCDECESTFDTGSLEPQ